MSWDGGTPAHAQEEPAKNSPSPAFLQFSGLQTQALSPNEPVDVPVMEAVPPVFDDSPPPAPENAVGEYSEGIDVENEGDIENGVVVPEGPEGRVEYVQRSEDTQLFLELILDEELLVFDAAFPVYQEEETALVPLRRFSEIVGFQIGVDTAQGAAQGWFIDPGNTFALSYPYRFVEIAGKKIPVRQPGIVETHMDDIYVSLDLLNSWFPIGLTLNYNELRLYIKPLQDLPVQERAQRRDRWETYQKQARRKPGLDYDPKDVIHLPYRHYSAPSLQFTHAVGRNLSVAGSTGTTSTTVNALGDLLGMSARAALAFGTSTAGPEEIQAIQFNLTREDFDGTLLGPLRATRYELGDISANPPPLAGQSSGRGFTVTNQPYNFVSDASRFRITGFATPGWDVEVFQGSELVAFGPVGIDGRYTFEDIQLREGFNAFRIVLYGPSGEKEERYDRFYLGQNMVPKGEVYYSVTGLQSSTPLLDVSTSRQPETPPTLAAGIEYGLAGNLSLMSGFYHGELGSTVLHGANLGLRASTGSAYAQAATFFDRSGGQSFSGLVTGNLTEKTSFNVQDTLHRNYAPGVRTTLRDTGGQVSRLFEFKNKILPSVNITLGAGRSREEGGLRTTEFTKRMTSVFLGMNLANEMTWSRFSDGSASTYAGILSARKRTRFGLLHGDLNYDFKDPARLTSAAIDLQTDIRPDLTLTTALTHGFLDPSTTRLSAGLDWKRERVRWGLTGSLDNRKNREIFVSLSYNLVPQSPYGDYALGDISGDVSAGRLILRPFIDKNDNGVYDPGEPPVENLRFRNMLRGTSSTRGEGGLVLLGGLTPSLANRIVLEEESLSDIYLIPRRKELLVLGKTGANGPVDYPFSKLGDISGTMVKVDAQGVDIPLSDVQIILLDEEGRQVTDTYTESDGYFSFGSIPIGNYELFFPVSETLSSYYSGDGQGPKLGITFDAPELTDVRLEVEQNRILHKTSSEALPQDGQALEGAREEIPEEKSSLPE